MTASLLVALQMILMSALLLPVRSAHGPALVAGLLTGAGLAWLVWTLAVNPPGNIHIRPLPKPGARLVTGGPYRLVRHPMYLGVLATCAGPACLWPADWKAGVWLLLAAVLVAKARREERALAREYREYDAFRRTRRFLVPGLW